MPTDPNSLQQLSAAWAACITRAEQPAPFSSRDGSVLRLVPSNERLSRVQLQQHLAQLLSEQHHLVEDFKANLGCCNSQGKALRHTAAWGRGWCYLQAGNNRQALKDANSAMAYAADVAGRQPSTKSLLNASNSTAIPNLPLKTAAEAAALGDSCTVATAAAVTEQHTKLVAGSKSTQSTYPTTACTWIPALHLAAECHAAFNSMSHAVVLLAQAAQQAPHYAVMADRLAELARQLPPEQGLAWRTGGLSGLLQQLQDESEMKLPEVLRPRPKWYYYNKWMTQRIHTALLELHLGCALSSGQLEGPSSGQLMLAAKAAADTPAIAAAAAAAGFLGSAATEAKLQQEQELMLQLPKPVIDKLLSLDAGDLDLMIKYPTALQAQVYELLDVYELQGTVALEGHTILNLSWEEVKALAAAGDGVSRADSPLIGLPLGYSPPRKQPTVPAGVAAVLPALTDATQDTQGSALALEGPKVPSKAASDCIAAEDGIVDDSKGCGGSLIVSAYSSGGAVVGYASGWRQTGWRRSEYLLGRECI